MKQGEPTHLVLRGVQCDHERALCALWRRPLLTRATCDVVDRLAVRVAQLDHLAAAHVLQLRLELKVPPIDADNPRPIASSVAADLRQRVLALPE